MSMINHIPLRTTVLSLVIAFAGTSTTAQSARENQPNIIFILTDDLGYGDLGVFYQNQREQIGDPSEPWMYTPNLDKLAAAGAILPDHYSAAPVCAPSRASILLGVSQGHANVRDNQFDKALEDNHTIASVLQEAGYATAAIGKWGLQGDNRWNENGDAWPAHPLHRGFDYYFGYMRHVDGHEHYPKEGPYREPKEVWENTTEISTQLDKCYTADLWTAAAKKWIVSTVREAKKPFFMYLAFDTPHAVLELPTQSYPDGGGLNGGMQWLGEPGRMITTAAGTIDSWIHPDYANARFDHDKDPSTTPVPWPDTYQRYATAVRRIDSAVGDIVQLLKDLDVFSNTLIVFTSDNGPSLESYLPANYVQNNPDFFNSFGPFDGVKRDCWEGGVRMPTIACWPSRIPAGSLSDHPGISYDWLPTFADAAGVAAPARCDGVSLLPSLTGNGDQRESLIYIEYFHGGSTPKISEFDEHHRGRKRGQMQMMRIGDIVGVRYDVQSHDTPFEVYNVATDPSQTYNLAGMKGMDSVQRFLHDRVLQVRRPDTAAERPYDGVAVSPVIKPNTRGGLMWKAYAGPFPWVPSVDGLHATKEGRAVRPDPSIVASLRQGDAVVFEGFIRIERETDYEFFLNSSIDALLRIHDATIIDIHEGHGMPRGKIRLKPGLHPVRLYCLAKGEKRPLLDLQWAGPDRRMRSIPASLFRH